MSNVKITLGNESVEKYKIVLPTHNSSYLVIAAVNDLVDKISSQFGVKLEVLEDREEVAEFEITVDNCNRAGVNTTLRRDEFEIKTEGKKVFINGGHNYSTAFAVRKFSEMLPCCGDFSPEVKGVCDAKTADLDGYSLVWSDEFDGDTLDTSTWSVLDKKGADWYGSWFGRKPLRNKDNIKLKDSKLYLVPTYDDDYFYGSYLTTANSMEFCGGYMEISARVADGQGVWHDFWTWSNEKEHLEFDIMECWGGAFRYVNVIHEFSEHNEKKDFEITKSFVHKHDHRIANWITYKDQEFMENPENSMNQEFHTFGCEWTADKVIFTRDGEVTLEFNISDSKVGDLYKNPHYFILSMLVGSNYANYTTEEADAKHTAISYPKLDGDYWNNDKGSFIIDYIHLYQKDGQTITIK